jgi:hypothetical protein
MRQMGDFRWLPVGPKNQPDVTVALLAIPGPPVMDEQTTQHVRDIVAGGFGGTLFLEPDNVDSAYKDLTSRGVEFPEKPEPRQCGIDSSFRNPSGNTIRLVQPPA